MISIIALIDELVTYIYNNSHSLTFTAGVLERLMLIRGNVVLASGGGRAEKPEKCNDRKRESVLVEADKIVNGARQSDYGTPWVNHDITAQYWSLLFNIPITAEQVCKANILQKLARSHNAYKRDNYVDIAGYAENADLCVTHGQMGAREGVQEC